MNFRGGGSYDEFGSLFPRRNNGKEVDFPHCVTMGGFPSDMSGSLGMLRKNHGQKWDELWRDALWSSRMYIGVDELWKRTLWRDWFTISPQRRREESRIPVAQREGRISRGEPIRRGCLRRCKYAYPSAFLYICYEA